MVEDRKKQETARGVDLPIDIITDILSRLSIEDLVRSKAVCYTWKQIITLDPSFRELQCKRASCKDQRIILETYKNTLFLVDETHGNWICKKLSPEEVPIRDNKIVGSCNGLLCIASCAGTLYIYNPIIRAYEILPSPNKIINRYLFHYGFGFDSVSNKYKAVCVYSRYSGYEEPATRGEILTLGENSWREIEVPVNVLFKRGLKTVVSGGAFHWMIDKKDVRWSGSEGVLALDIHTEKFDTINFNPGNGSLYEVESDKILVNFDEKLAIVEQEHPDVELRHNVSRVRVWELAGSKANERWFKEYACFSLPKRTSRYPREILRLLNDGNLLAKDHDSTLRKVVGTIERVGVAFYNQQEESYSRTRIVNAPRRFKVHFFVPTLASPTDIIQ